MRALTAAFLAVAMGLAGCSGGDHRVTGVVVGVDGDLTALRSFEVLTTDGDRLEIVPGPGVVAFADGTPLTHLSEHFLTGAAVRITYRVEETTNVALVIEDAP